MIMRFFQTFDNIIDDLRGKSLLLKKSRETVSLKNKEYQQKLQEYEALKEYFTKSATGRSIVDSIEDKFKSYNSSFLDFVKREEKIQNKLQKSIDSIYRKNPDIVKLQEYKNIIPENKFTELLVTLTKSHKQGLISKDRVLDLKKYKRVDLEKGSVYVKDDRTHYSDCIVINELNEVLLLKRNKLDSFEAAKYCLPGGHVDDGEDFQYAALRELIEETGIKSETAVPSGEYTDNKIVIHYFTVKVEKDKCNVFLDEREHQQYEWVSIGDIHNYPLIKNLDKNFEDVILIPTWVINHDLTPNFYIWNNGGSFLSKPEIKQVYLANKLYKSYKDGLIDYEHYKNHIKYNDIDVQMFSIYNLSQKPLYGLKLNNNIEKSHKYIKREGGPGKYRYIYPEDLKETERAEVNPNDPYTYKGTEMLVNKLGIRNKGELSEKERVVVGEKVDKISKMDFSSSGFKKLHNELFGDLYEWAGKTRTVNLSNGNVTFTPMRFLEEGLNSEFQKIQSNIKNKDKFSDEQWINKAGDHFGEIIFIHPFREGNGRTTRKFIDLFLKEKGLNLIWGEIDIDEYYKASEQAINKADNSLIKELFLKHIVN